MQITLRVQMLIDYDFMCGGIEFWGSRQHPEGKAAVYIIQLKEKGLIWFCLGSHKKQNNKCVADTYKEEQKAQQVFGWMPTRKGEHVRQDLCCNGR
jgi:hypothetical protein